jgi:hypothetical protein
LRGNWARDPPDREPGGLWSMQRLVKASTSD